MRFLPALLLCLAWGVPAAAQVDPVRHRVIVLLHDHGCRIGEEAAREALAAKGIKWQAALAEMRRLVEERQAFTADGGRTFMILPPLCEPEPVVVPYDGPDRPG